LETSKEYKTQATNQGFAYDPRLNACEIGELWNTYMAFSMYSCIYKYCLNSIADQDIKSLLQSALDLSNQRVTWVMDIFTKEGLPIPFGYGEEDLNIQAPSLYSDQFYLQVLMYKCRIGLVIQGLALTSSVRSDVREFYENCCSSTMQLYQRAVELLLAKGLYINPPHITTSETNDFVKKQKFLAGYLTDKRRPLLAKEISSLFQAISVCNIAKSILIGFRQSAKSKQVRNYMDNGVNLMNKALDRFSVILVKENIPIPMVSDTFVTDSTEPPFSDKLMMAKIAYTNEAGIILCGESIANNMRHDLLPAYSVIMADVATYTEDGVKIMIENGWLEEPPRIVDRKNLLNEKQ
jgi:hypothetical protein